MTRKELSFLALVWIGLAALAVATIEVAPALAPVMGRFVTPLAILPTLFVYFTVFVPFYLFLRLIFWPFPPGRWRQWTADVVALAATLALAFAVPAHFNPIVRAKAAALEAGEMPLPIELVPVRSIALLHLDGNPVYEGGPSRKGLKVCDEFCTALLVSGYAREVVVGFELSRTGRIAPEMTGLRYVLNGKRPECIHEDKEWPAWFAGKALSQARQIGGYGPAFVARYASCIAAQDSAPIAKTDVVFLHHFQHAYPGPEFWGINWIPEFVDVLDSQVVFENRGAKMIQRIRRTNIVAATLDAPMYFSFSGPIESFSTGWARTTILRTDPGLFADGWWGMITNGEEIYAASLARDRVVGNR